MSLSAAAEASDEGGGEAEARASVAGFWPVQTKLGERWVSGLCRTLPALTTLTVITDQLATYMGEQTVRVAE